MKKTIILSSLFLCLMLGISFMFSPTTANALSKNNGITVSGEAEIKTGADKATISFSVETLAETLLHGQQELWQKVEAIKESLSEYETEKSTLVTNHFHSYKKYSYSEGKETFLGHNSQATLSISTANLSNIKNLIEVISSNATSLNNINFYKEDTQQLYSQALEKAFQDAQAKANALKQDKPIFLYSLIEEVFYNNYCHSDFKTLSLENETFNSNITIKAKVKAHFTFEEKANLGSNSLYNSQHKARRTNEPFTNFETDKEIINTPNLNIEKTPKVIDKEKNNEPGKQNFETDNLSTENHINKTTETPSTENHSDKKTETPNLDFQLQIPEDKPKRELEPARIINETKTNEPEENIITNTSYTPVSV